MNLIAMVLVTQDDALQVKLVKKIGNWLITSHAMANEAVDRLPFLELERHVYLYK